MRIVFVAVMIIGFVHLSASVRADQGLTVTPVMKGTTTIGGHTLAYPDGKQAEIEAIIVEVAPGQQSGLHMHPVPTYVHVLSGTLTVDLADGSSHQFGAGKGFLEDVQAWHNVKNSSQKPLKFLVVFAGKEGSSNLIWAKTLPQGK